MTGDRPTVVLLATLLLGSTLWAGKVRPVNLEEMTDRAATIFSGRCTDVRVVPDATLGTEVTLVTFEVDRAVKGELGPTHRIRVLGSGERSGIAGMPRFEPGEEVVLFLYGESRLGLSSPVGLGQGKFVVGADKQGRRLALRELGGEMLFDGVAPGLRATEREEALDPDALLDLVEGLLR